ncbi:MAG: M20/M25/M40 family metallo-hydrolase [Flavipsychrobacter sp.]|nr:M20/M25/M40 family metallo-hydrolase [Flavipsychrobacter sp.]
MKKLLVAAAAIAISASFAFKKKGDIEVDLDVINRIKTEGFNNSRVMETLWEMTELNGPRLTGSAGMKKAEAWAKAKLESWGLANAAIEPWGTFGKGWETSKCYVAMATPYYQQMIAVPKAWTPGTNGLIKAETYLVKVEEEEDLAQYKGKLNGRIAVLLTSTPGGNKAGFNPDAKRLTDEELSHMGDDPHLNDEPAPVMKGRSDKKKLNARELRAKINTLLREEGAIAVLSGRRGTMGTLFTSNGASYKMDAEPVLPELELGAEHMDRLVRLLDAGKEVKVEMELNNTFSTTDSLEYNVVAEIPGTDKNLKAELVMLGGHMDSWHGATGVTDNGTGTAVMMEAVRILKALDLKPRRTIRVILWSGEEQGLLGSRGYAKNHFGDLEKKEFKPEMELVSAYYNLDNGAGKIRGIYLQGNDMAMPYFQQWFAPFESLGAQTVTIRNTGGTDHLSFDAYGIPGFQFIQDPLEYGTRTHHTNMDTYERAIPADLMQASVIVASLVYHTAMLDEKLPRKPIKK